MSFRFKGEGDDDPDHFYASGWLNPLPPQPANCDIPGWHRITFMKHFFDDDDQLGEELWAYEGVVLPGGQIILGRWWWVTEPPKEDVSSISKPNYILYVTDNAKAYSGPFIFWNVDSYHFNEGNSSDADSSQPLEEHIP